MAVCRRFRGGHGPAYAHTRCRSTNQIIEGTAFAQMRRQARSRPRSLRRLRRRGRRPVPEHPEARRPPLGLSCLPSRGQVGLAGGSGVLGRCSPAIRAGPAPPRTPRACGPRSHPHLPADGSPQTGPASVVTSSVRAPGGASNTSVCPISWSRSARAALQDALRLLATGRDDGLTVRDKRASAWSWSSAGRLVLQPLETARRISARLTRQDAELRHEPWPHEPWQRSR